MTAIRLRLVLSQAVLGIGSYLYLFAAGQQLTPEEFAVVGVFWSVAFSLGLGLSGPLEVLLSRDVASGAVRATGPRIIRLYAGVAATLCVIGLVVAVAIESPGRLIAATGALYLPLLLLAAAQRGLSAGTLSFRSYMWQVSTEGVARGFLAGVLVLVAMRVAGWWLMVLVAATLLAIAAGFSVRDRGLLSPGRSGAEPPTWTRTAVTAMTLTAVFGINLVLANSLPSLAAVIGADPDQLAALSAAVTVVRLPMFFVGLAVAVVVPMVASADSTVLPRLVRRTVRTIGVIAGASFVALGLVAGLVVRLAYPRLPELPSGQLWLLALSIAALLAATLLGSILVAEQRVGAAAGTWTAALLVYVIVSALPVLTPVDRVIVASALASVVAATVFTVQAIPARRPSVAVPDSPDEQQDRVD